jgi:hypothetical protein
MTPIALGTPTNSQIGLLTGPDPRQSRTHQRLRHKPVVGPRVIGPSRASASGALLAELQEPAERLRKIVA